MTSRFGKRVRRLLISAWRRRVSHTASGTQSGPRPPGRLPGADQALHFTCGGHAAGGFLGEDQGAVDGDVELAGAAPADGRGDAEGALELVLEADRLVADIQSEEAALDLDLHRVILLPSSRGSGGYPRGGETRPGVPLCSI